MLCVYAHHIEPMVTDRAQLMCVVVYYFLLFRNTEPLIKPSFRHVSGRNPQTPLLTIDGPLPEACRGDGMRYLNLGPLRTSTGSSTKRHSGECRNPFTQITIHSCTASLPYRHSCMLLAGIHLHRFLFTPVQQASLNVIPACFWQESIYIYSSAPIRGSRHSPG